MVYRIRKGTSLHNKVLNYITESNKWIITATILDEMFDFNISEIGWYSKLDKNNSLKVNYENIPNDKKKYFNKKGYLLKNNKYYQRWNDFVNKINLHSTEDNIMDNFKLEIFINPIFYIDIDNFDLLIKIDCLKEKNDKTETDYDFLNEYYLETDLEDIPNYNEGD